MSWFQLAYARKTPHIRHFDFLFFKVFLLVIVYAEQMQEDQCT